MSGLSCLFIVFSATPSYAMHIAEGFLPIKWAIFWWLITLPFLIIGFRSLNKLPVKTLN